jgi:hypothetical protein
MSELVARLRWFPIDLRREIAQADLDRVSQACSAQVSMERVDGARFKEVAWFQVEDTLDVPISEITQTVVTVSAADEAAFRRAVRELIRLYRAPKTPFALWGSSERGLAICRELADEDSGW